MIDREFDPYENFEVADVEVEKVILLLGEYTIKLRQLCERRDGYRLRLFQFSMFVSGLFLFVIVGGYFFVEAASLPLEKSVVAGVSIGFIFLVTLPFFISSSRLRHSYDADMVAASVERLIRLASQLGEHSRRKISNLIELDLRIGEAEGALRYYHRVFRVSEAWTSKG